MNQKQKKFIEENTISVEEFSKDFTNEQKRIVENEIAYYDALQALKKTRKQQGLTQADLAKKADMPRTTITKVESGSYNPTLHTLMNMAAAMGKRIKITLL
ncbi:helix-turn-helix domain-containing protein [Patescibacteria group bacterium]|nr:helix-turn-helix domain-containing protein [Patescibacteria group bacterium]MBU1884997.1 helix-turn-helix domain-containing protein [Patescibacteria group bacterium]